MFPDVVLIPVPAVILLVSAVELARRHGRRDRGMELQDEFQVFQDRASTPYVRATWPLLPRICPGKHGR